jgi:hypothetical protein
MTDSVMRLITQGDWTSDTSSFTSLSQLLPILGELEAAQAPFVLVDSSHPFVEKAARLHSWLASHPHFFSKGLTLVDDLGPSRGDRGLRVGPAGAEAEELLLSVPLDLNLSVDSAVASHELGPLLESPGLAALRQFEPSLLALHLLVEHAKALEVPEPVGGAPPSSESFGRTAEEIAANRVLGRAAMEAAMRGDGPMPDVRTSLSAGRAHPWGSRWRAYMALLPSSVPNSLYWTLEDWAAVRGTAAFSIAKSHLLQTIAMWARLDRHMGEGAEGGSRIAGMGPHFTWAAYRWAVAIVMSRQNPLPSVTNPSGDSRGIPSLSPLFDMCNHASDAGDARSASVSVATLPPLPAPAGSTQPPKQRYVLLLDTVAFKAFGPGQELTHAYGSRPGTQLLVFQGFTSPEALGPGRDLGAPVLASLGDNTTSDPLHKVRVNALAAAGITLTSHRRVASDAAIIAIRQRVVLEETAKRGAEAAAALLDSMSSERLLREHGPAAAERWAWPLSFEAAPRQGPEGVPGLEEPTDLLSFCRIAALCKEDTLPLLRMLQQHAGAAKEAEKAGLLAAAAGGGGGHGHSHGGAECTGSHGVDVPPLRIPALLTASSEAKALEMAEKALASTLALIDDWKGADAGRGGVLSPAFLDTYRRSQREGVTRALAAVAKARADCAARGQRGEPVPTPGGGGDC